MTAMSLRRGTLRKVTGPSTNNVAARIGSDAFLLPETWT